jgi:hypothetical protein
MNHGFGHMIFFIFMYMASALVIGAAMTFLLKLKDRRRTKAVNNAWVYGYVKGTRARLNTITNQCQFVLWKAGEQGHTEDFWHNMGDGWVKHFVAD